MNSDGLMTNLLLRGYEVTFKHWSGSGGYSCCVEFPGGNPGAKSFAWGKDLDAALLRAATDVRAVREPIEEICYCEGLAMPHVHSISKP